MKHWLGQQQVREHGLYESREGEQVPQVGGVAKLGKVPRGDGEKLVDEEDDHAQQEGQVDQPTRQHSSNSTYTSCTPTSPWLAKESGFDASRCFDSNLISHRLKPKEWTKHHIYRIQKDHGAKDISQEVLVYKFQWVPMLLHIEYFLQLPCAFTVSALLVH